LAKFSIKTWGVIVSMLCLPLVDKRVSHWYKRWLDQESWCRVKLTITIGGKGGQAMKVDVESSLR
jgi:hypothetical protein